jgi:hypothetical protein
MRERILWGFCIILLVACWFLPWGHGWLATNGRRGVYIISLVHTPTSTWSTVLVGLFISIFGFYFLPVEFGLWDTTSQGITAIVSGFLVTFSALWWIMSPYADVGLLAPHVSSPFLRFDGTILYGAYLAVIAGVLIIIVGTCFILRSVWHAGEKAKVTTKHKRRFYA